MNRTVIAAIDFPRQQLRGAIVGAMISLGVVTGWQILAQTNISVVLQCTAAMAYVLAVYRTLNAAKEIRDILGRGLVAFGTMGLLCAALLYLHAPAAAGTLMFWAASGAAVLGLWLTRPPHVAPFVAPHQGNPRAMASASPEFIAFHQAELAPAMAEVEQIRRKTEWDYWKLSALGLPVATALGLGLIITDLAGRPPGWLFGMAALTLLLCGIGAAILSWKPSANRREEILWALGGYVGLSYHFGGAEDPDQRAATVFGSADHGKRLSLLPPYRELKLGAAFRGSRAGQPFIFGEVTTIPPRKLGTNTARMSRNFLLFVMDLPGVSPSRTICYEDRGLLGHPKLRPNLAFDGAPPGPVEGADLVKKVILGPNQGSWEIKHLGLGNSEFEARFTIYTEDEEDARAQLTAPFMAAMMRARHALPLIEVPRFAFDEGQFIAAIEAPQPWLDLLLPRAMAIDDPRYAAAIMDRLQMILHIADSLAPETDAGK
jgi:hypothetical protein